MPISKGEAAIVPRPELASLVESEERTAMILPVAELTMRERHMAESKHDIAVAELQHETVLAKVTEVSWLEPGGMLNPECEITVAELPRLELWGMSELERETTAVEVSEVPRLEPTMLSKHATVVELEAMVSQVQLRPSLPREMAGTEPSVTCLGWLRRHSQCRHDSCEHHHFAHRVVP